MADIEEELDRPRALPDCPICLHQYNLKGRLPKVLRCGHTLCMECMQNILKSSSIVCPCCRTPTPGDGVKTNFAFTEMLENLCEDCVNGVKIKSCLHCGNVLCTVCLDTHYKRFYTEIKEKLSKLNDTIKLVTLTPKNSEDQIMIAKTEIQKIKTDIVYHKKALDSLQVRLIQTVERMKNCNIEKMSDWKKESDIVVSDTKNFIKKSQKDLGTIYNKRISPETVGKISDQCEKLKATMMEIINNAPQMTQYCYQGPGETYMSDCAQVVLNSNAVRFVSTESYKTAKVKRTTGSLGSGADDFNKPWGLACTHDRIFVADERNHRVKVYDHNLKFKFMFGAKGSDRNSLTKPVGIALGPDDKLYVSDFCNHRVKVYSKTGEMIRTFGSLGSGDTQLNLPHGIAVSKDGLVFIADSKNYRIQVLQPDGSYVCTIGSKGTGPGKFENILTSIAVTKDNRVLVNELNKKNVHVFNTIGVYQGLIPKTLPDTITDFVPTAVAVDNQDNIIVAEPCGRLVVLDKEGNFTCTVGNKDSRPQDTIKLLGIAATPDGNIVVSDGHNNLIQIYDVPFI